MNTPHQAEHCTPIGWTCAGEIVRHGMLGVYCVECGRHGEQLRDLRRMPAGGDDRIRAVLAAASNHRTTETAA